AGVLTVLALLFVWSALVAPDQPILLRPGAFLRLPLEGFVLLVVALALPPRGRRVMAWVLGPVLALVVLLKVLNIGFFAAFNRPFDIYQDVSYAGIGRETRRESIGGAHANMVLIGLGVLIVALLVLMTLAVRR